jgi:mannose-6-phosphate isomerase
MRLWGNSVDSPDPGFFRLHNGIKHYPWGSPRWIPELINQANPGAEPFAELWMGVHPLDPSFIERDGTRQSLSGYIESYRASALGGLENIPFLFKVLAAEKPLSLQVHPNAAQAREGWERENRAGLDPADPRRNYKDPNHKPEILCALGPFTALCGFREGEECAALLEALDLPVLTEPLKALRGGGKTEEKLNGLLRALVETGPSQRRLLTEGILGGLEKRLGTFPAYKKEWELSAKFAKLYPDDPGMLAPFWLRVLALKPLEAVFLRAGVMHSYVEGFGVELMANSDNVLRGGLTPKHIDLDELFAILDFSPHAPAVLKAPAKDQFFYSYPLPREAEFSLSLIRGSDTAAYPLRGPFIVLLIQGGLTLRGRDARLSLEKGQSAFISAQAAETLTLEGKFLAFAAACRHQP